MSGDPPTADRGRLRARAVHRVGPEDRGQRVSIRHLVPTGGSDAPVATDVVGRLLGYRDEILVLVDRDGQLALVAEDTIIASRVIPPHPRLPPEPSDLGTEDRPLPRDAARVLLVDASDRVLLVAHRPSADELVWTAPGGGLHVGEDHHAAACRELREELGLSLDVGPWVWSRHVTFAFAGVWLEQTERWFLARLDAGAPYDETGAPLDDPGLDHARWWSLAELRRTDAVLAPRALPRHLEELLRTGPPDPPVDVGR